MNLATSDFPNPLALFRSLLLWLLLTSTAALMWPVETLGPNPFALSTEMLWGLIVVTMFSLGTLVRPDELKPLRSRPWWVALGVAAQVLVMPAAAWAVTRVIPMSPDLAAGVILVGCVPGAMASNVLTHAAGGSVAYSVSLTTVATLLSPLTVPSVLWVVADVRSEQPLLSPGQQATTLFLLVVLPTMVGYVMARQIPWVRYVARRVASPLASICLLWIIASVVAGNQQRLWEVGAVLLVALLLINVIGYVAGWATSSGFRLPQRYRRALTLEVGMQNAGLGTAMASKLYGEETIATIPTAAYTFGCMLTGTILASYWRRNGGPCDEDGMNNEDPAAGESSGAGELSGG